MKKLFYIFAILFTVFNTTAWGDSFQDVQSALESDGFLLWSKYDSLPPECTSPVKQELDIPYTDDKTSFTCGYTNYYCKKGQLPSECAPCALSLLSNKYIDNFKSEFAKVAYQNGATDFHNVMLNRYESKYSEWAATACNNMFQNKTNQEYADTLRDPNNWQKYEAQPAVSAPRTDATTSNTITISGTVNDDMGPVIGANVFAIDSNGKTIQDKIGAVGTATDTNGYFEIKNFPSDARLQISYMGFTTQTFTIDEWNNKNNETTLQEDTHSLENVIVTSCKTTYPDYPGGIKFHHADAQGLCGNDTDNDCEKAPNGEDPKCVPTQCDEPRYKIQNENTLKATCVEQSCEIKNGTGKWTGMAKNWQCTIDTCKSGYKPNGNNTECIKMAKKCNENDAKKLENAGASDTGLRAGTEICIALDCKCGYTLNGEKCDPWEKDKDGKYTKPCEKSELEKLNAKSGILACNDRGKAFCEITECISSDYTHNTEKNTCDSKNKTPCDTIPENATDAEYRTVDGKLVCTINKCADGYERNADKTKCNPTPKLSREDSKKKIAELQENADAMRAKEQSTENKLLGGASMAATGIGGMQVMSALAEQSADADAEAAMRAYLATFHCNYGGGVNIPGGEKDVQLPGGNELVGLYSEYVNLANDLKVRKNALGMKPGIESESILDSATSGLYDDVAIGKTSGAFTSLARALQNPDGPDAAAWAAQKSDTANKLKTGATIAGIGAVGGAVGNLLINKNAPKENSKEINKKYEALKKLESDVAQIPPQTAKCPSGTSGNAYPDCTCNDKTKIFNPNTNACDACPGNQIVIDGKCNCPTDKPLWDTENNTCIAKPTNCTPQCNPAEGNHLRMSSDCSCDCIDGYDLENGSCVCKSPRKEQGGQCIIIQTNTVTKTIQQQINTTVDSATLPAGSLFKIGSYELVDEAKTALNSFVQTLTDGGYTDCKLTIDGYTDPIGGSNTNQKLSENRAKAVEKYFKDLNKKHITNTHASGHGESGCTCGTRGNTEIDYSKADYKTCRDKGNEYTVPDGHQFAPCRRVEITAECKKTTTTVTTTQQ